MKTVESEKAVHREPVFGIIMLDTAFPRVAGDIGNPGTFDFPVLYEVVKGADSKRVVKEADVSLLQPFIAAGKLLEGRGADAIATSCGFLSLFHRELADALDVPVFSSSLQQVPFVHQLIRKEQKIGVMTVCKQSLTTRHLAGVGIESYPLAIVGMDDAEEFSAVFIDGKTTLDTEKCRTEMRAAARKLMDRSPDIGAIVLECTNMPPYAPDVREVTGLPVFDVVTMINYGYAALKRPSFG